MAKVKKILQEATDLLCEYLQPGDVLRQLKTKGTIEQKDVEKIKKQDSTTEMVEKLLDILMRKPVFAYETFMEILKEKRHDLFVQVKDIEIKHHFGSGKHQLLNKSIETRGISVLAAFRGYI